MRVFFFGCKSASAKGHFLYNSNMQEAYREQAKEIPFRIETLDGGLLPVGKAEVQGLWHRSVINDWTVITCWDRSADPRGQSNAAFIAEGIHTTEEMRIIAQRNFTEIWNRIHGIAS